MSRILKEGIRFEAVSFCYPGSPGPALKGLDLEIPSNRTTALVGANGAGKSTIIKLLCRFYEPDAGRLTLDGIDIRDISIMELRRRITVLFQQPLHYEATAADNIAPGGSKRERPRNEIEEAAVAAGAHRSIMRLPQEYDTMLGKWFGGAETQRRRMAATCFGTSVPAPRGHHCFG